MQADGELLPLLVAAVRALPHCKSDLDLGLHRRGDDSGNANELRDLVALKSAQLSRHLIRVHLHLKLGILFHVRIVDVKDLRVVYDLDSALESLDVLRWRVLEILGELLVERVELGHFESKVVLSSLDIVLELFSVGENVIFLCFSDKMHEFVLSIMQGVLVLVALQVVVDQVLIGVEDPFSVKVVHGMYEILTNSLF